MLFEVVPVRVSARDLCPVGDLEQGADRLVGNGSDFLDRAGHIGDGHDHPEGDHQPGEQSPEATEVEASDPNPSVPLHLSDQDEGGEEAGQHKEGVHTEEAVAEPVGAVEQHGEDRDAPQTIDRGEARPHGFGLWLPPWLGLCDR